MAEAKSNNKSTNTKSIITTPTITTPTKTTTTKTTPTKTTPTTHTIPKKIRISINDAKRYFSALIRSNIKFDQLKFTDVSLYSTTPWDQALYTVKILLSFYTQKQLKDLVITDGNACIGGNTWAFAKVCRAVNAVEISSIHADILENNLSVLGFNNVKIYNKNYLALYSTLYQNVLFLDPPWGGVNYKDQTMELFYVYEGKKYHLHELLDEISYLCELLIIKLPYNSNFNALTRNNFRYYNRVDIKTPDGKVIYTLLFLHNIPLIKPIPIQDFERLGYKGIRYELVE